MYTVLGYNDMSSRILPFSFKTVEVVWRERNFWRWDCITLHLVRERSVKRKSVLLLVKRPLMCCSRVECCHS